MCESHVCRQMCSWKGRELSVGCMLVAYMLVTCMLVTCNVVLVTCMLVTCNVVLVTCNVVSTERAVQRGKVKFPVPMQQLHTRLHHKHPMPNITNRVCLSVFCC